MISLPLLEVAATLGPICRMRKVPTVVDVRDLYPDNYLSALEARLGPALPLVAGPLRLLAKVALRAPTARYAISEDFLRWAEGLAGPGGQLDRAIPLPFPGGLEEPPSRRADSNAPVTAVFLGAFNRIIDLHTVIDAACQLEEQRPGAFRFVLAGDGEFKDELMAYADGCSSIEFPGWIEASEVRDLLGAADVGLAPYRPATASAMGNKYMEYLWASLPILSADPPIARRLENERAGYGYSSAQELTNLLGQFSRGDLSVSVASAREFFDEKLNRGQSQQEMANELEDLARSVG